MRRSENPYAGLSGIQAEEKMLRRQDEQEQTRIIRGHEICGLCGKPEPVDRNREFLTPCPRKRMQEEYVVELTACATVEARVHVKAASEEAARAQALTDAKAGNIVWNYAGADDATIGVALVRKEAA